MAIAFRQSSSVAYGSHASTVVTKPTGTVDGDVIYVAIFAGQAGSAPAVTQPGGWTQIGTAVTGDDGSFFGTWSLWRKVASAEGASWTWTHATVSTSAACVAYSGVDNTTPEDVTQVQQANSQVGQSWSFPSITPVTNGAMILEFGADWADGSGRTPPGGYTERLDFINQVVNELLQTTAAATGAQAETNSNINSTEPLFARTVALRPSSGGGGGTTSPLLLESGNVILLEDGTALMLEA